MIRYLLGEHPVEFIVVWETVAVSGALLIRTVRRSGDTLAETVKHMNENRENRKGKDPEAGYQDPEMAMSTEDVDTLPEWMR